METVVFVLSIMIWFLCPVIIGLILLQGAAGDISSAFGGGGQLDSTLGVGAHRKMSKVTGFLAGVFFIMILVLAYQHRGSLRNAPVKPAQPAVNQPAAPAPAKPEVKAPAQPEAAVPAPAKPEVKAAAEPEAAVPAPAKPEVKAEEPAPAAAPVVPPAPALPPQPAPAAKP